MQMPVVHFSAIDILLILLYFAGVMWVGFRARRHHKSSTEEYLLAGRSLTLPVFVATLVSTWYGGILGVGEYSYRYGISNWVVFGIPYYFFALIFALFLARKAREGNAGSVPEQLYRTYGRPTSLLGALLTFVLVTPAAYVLMLGVLVELIFGIDLVPAVLLSTFATICYLYAGGFRSDVHANVLEFVLMFLGFAVVVVFAYSHFGGIEYLRSHLPALHLTWHGGNSMQFILVWFFIALWTLVDPAFYQRCAAAKDGRTAKRGILISIIFWLVFDFLTSAAGLYARAALPDLREPMFSYPMLAEAALPAVAKSIFYIGMLATIMSTLSSLTFIGGTTIGNDVVGRLMEGREAAEKNLAMRRWSQYGLVITGVFAVLLAILIPSVVKLWYSIGTAIIPGLLVPLMASYFPALGMRSRFAFAAMLGGWLISSAWMVNGQMQGGVYFLGIEPMYPGLIFSIAVWGIDRASMMMFDRKNGRQISSIDAIV